MFNDDQKKLSVVQHVTKQKQKQVLVHMCVMVLATTIAPMRAPMRAWKYIAPAPIAPIAVRRVASIAPVARSASPGCQQ